VPLPDADVFQPLKVYPVRVKTSVVNAAETFKVSVSGTIVPIPPLALNVMVTDPVGVTIFDGNEYVPLPTVVTAAT
jgi:hypothetical protein